MSTTTEKKDLGKIQSMFKFLKSHKFKIGAMIFVVIVVSLLIAYATGAFDATDTTDTPDTTTTPVTTIDIAPEGGDNNIIIIPTATGAVSGIDNGAITIEPTYNGPWPVDVTEVVLIHSIGKIVWQKSITSNVDGEFTFDLVDMRYQAGSDTLGNYGSGEDQLTKSLDEMDTLLSASKLYGSVEDYTNIQRRYKLESEACIISGNINLVRGDNINGSSINVVTSCDSSDLYKWTMEEYEDLSIDIHVVDTVVRSVDGSLSSKTVDKNSNLKLDDLIVIRYPQSIDPTAVKLTVTTTNDPDGEFNNILMGDVNHNVIQNGGFVRYKCKYIDGDENIFETTVILEINTPVSQ